MGNTSLKTASRPVCLSRFSAGVGLQKFLVGIGLQFDHVRRRDDLFDLAEVDSFSGSRWHFDFLVMAGNSAGPVVSYSTTQGKRAAFNGELAKLNTAVCYCS